MIDLEKRYQALRSCVHYDEADNDRGYVRRVDLSPAEYNEYRLLKCLRTVIRTKIKWTAIDKDVALYICKLLKIKVEKVKTDRVFKG